MNERQMMKDDSASNRVARSWAMRLLRVVCPPLLYEEIEGDLIQRFERERVTMGERRAARRLAWNAIRFVRPGIVLRNTWNIHLTPFYMILNYLTVAWRVMTRNVGYTTINVLGLGFGLTGALLLGLWVAHELSFDRFHRDVDRIHIVWNRQPKSDGSIACWSVTPRVLAPTLKSGYSGIEHALSFAAYGESFLFSVGDKHLVNTKSAFVDEDFLQVLTFPLVRGDERTALGNPNSIVVTEKFARQLFGDREALGAAITVSQEEQKFDFTVTGILKDLPSNTDLRFDALIPYSFVEKNFGKSDNWGGNSVKTLVKLKEGVSPSHLEGQIRDLKKKHLEGETTELFLYPLLKNHLYSRFDNGVPSGGRIEVVRMIGILAVVLVVIACINFINLSTARASRRMKEVAVRKVTGAARSSLVMQFLCESIIVTLIASAIALFAVYFLLTPFNTLTQQQLELNLISVAFWIGAGAFVVIVGIMAGGYPALYLSALMPVRILKGIPVGRGRSRVRDVLVVMQFGFALMLVVSTLVVYKQTKFLQQREVGYDRTNLVYQYLTGKLYTNYDAYQEALRATGYVASVTRTSSPVTERMSNTFGMHWRGKDPADNTAIERITVDQGLAETVGVTLVSGRDIDLTSYPADSSAVLINEAAARLMGFDDPLGETVEDDGIAFHIVGVVKDFIFTSPYRAVEPIVIQGVASWLPAGVVHIRLDDQKPVGEAIDAIANVARKLNPEYPFEYHFVDEAYARKFNNEKTTLSITTIFSGLAIFIGCLGLLGLATYLIETRLKEISIRKVLGGSVADIVGLLSSNALRPILWAVIVFAPAAWWSMNWWLTSYEYRIAFPWWGIPVAAALIVTMALSTIVIQIYRAARSNPASTLRSE